jgi:hypothetical protein
MKKKISVTDISTAIVAAYRVVSSKNIQKPRSACFVYITSTSISYYCRHSYLWSHLVPGYEGAIVATRAPPQRRAILCKRPELVQSSAVVQLSHCCCKFHNLDLSLSFFN